MQDGRQFFMDRQDVGAQQVKFSKQLNNQLKISGDTRLVYLFALRQNLVIQNHVHKYTRGMKKKRGIKIPVEKTADIICRIGSGKTVFTSQTK